MIRAFALDPLREVLHVARFEYLEVEGVAACAADAPDLDLLTKTARGRWDISDGVFFGWLYFDREPTEADFEAIAALLAALPRAPMGRIERAGRR